MEAGLRFHPRALYIPRLVEQIVTGPDAMLRGQLRGVLLGNPHIWCESLNKESAASHFQFVRSWFVHGLLPSGVSGKARAATDGAAGAQGGDQGAQGHAAAAAGDAVTLK